MRGGRGGGASERTSRTGIKKVQSADFNSGAAQSVSQPFVLKVALHCPLLSTGLTLFFTPSTLQHPLLSTPASPSCFLPPSRAARFHLNHTFHCASLTKGPLRPFWPGVLLAPSRPQGSRCPNNWAADDSHSANFAAFVNIVCRTRGGAPCALSNATSRTCALPGMWRNQNLGLTETPCLQHLQFYPKE